MKGQSRRFCPLSSSQPGTLSLSNAAHLPSKPNILLAISFLPLLCFSQNSDPFVPLTGRKDDLGSFPTLSPLPQSVFGCGAKSVNHSTTIIKKNWPALPGPRVWSKDGPRGAQVNRRRSVIYFTMSNLIRPLSCPAPAAEVVALKVATHRQLAYYLRFSDQSKKKKEKRKKQISVQTAWNRSSAVQMTDRTDSLVRCEPSSSSRWWSCCSSRDSTFWCICSVLRHHPLS